MTEENQSPGPSGEEELQRRIDDAMKRAITVNVNQVQGGGYSAPVTVETYPGLGAGWHLFHAFMTFFVIFGFWGIVWAIHARVAKKRWYEEQQLKRDAERQQREDQQ